MLGFKARERDLQMSSNDVVIDVQGLSKRYEIYAHPRDRLKQFLFPRFQWLFGIKRNQYFKEFWAVKDVNFQIRRGETVGIIGRNGSGKSTLLQMICGTLNPTRGSIQTKGRIAALLELGSGFNPEFTGRENVYMNAVVLGLKNNDIDERFHSITEFADIGDFIDQPVKTYSSGMLVRLAFAVIAHVDADILVVDEALAVGDAFFTQKCMRFLRNFMKDGTVLFVSHDTAAIKGLCSSAIWLEHGKILHQASPKHVCELYLEASYGNKNKIIDKSVNSPIMKHRDQISFKDQRMFFLNHSNLRNDLNIFQFNHESASFGNGGAEIIEAHILDEDGIPLSWIVGGEKVNLRIKVSAHQQLDSPIIGFSVKDRLGQVLFGDNTYISFQDIDFLIEQDDEIIANFVFMMPLLPVGEYSIAIAVANGTQLVHDQLHWLHDALIFKSESSSIATGLVGIPMMEIRLEKISVVSQNSPVEND